MASLESPPTGGDHNRGPILANIIIIIDVLATISVLARMYVRSRIVKKIGLDDVFIVLSIVSIAQVMKLTSLGSLMLLSRRR